MVRRGLWLGALVLGLVAPLGAVDLNGRGEVAMGIADGVVSIDGRVVTDGASGGWMTDDVLVLQTRATHAIALYDQRDGSLREVAPAGSNALMAGGGVWAAWLAGTGLYTSTDLRLPLAGLLGVGEDGSLGYVPDRQAGVPAVVRRPDGFEYTLSSGAVYDLQLLAGDRAIWTERQTIHTRGVSVLQWHPVWRPRHAIVNGEPWLCYWTSDGARLIARPAQSDHGYVLHVGENAFAHDCVGVGVTLVAAWAAREGERPEDLRKQTVNVLTTPRVALRDTAPPPPVPPPVPPPPPDPPPPSPQPQLPEAIFATLQRVRDRYPRDRALTLPEIGAILNEVAWLHRAEGGGLEWKADNGAPQPRTGITVWRGLRVGAWGYDVCGACSVGRFDPVRATGGPADPCTDARPGCFVPPVEPIGTTPDPTTDPTLAARVAALEAALGTLRTDLQLTQAGVNGLQATVLELSARVRTLEQQPGSLTPAQQQQLAVLCQWLDVLGVGVSTGAADQILRHAHLLRWGSGCPAR